MRASICTAAVATFALASCAKEHSYIPPGPPPPPPQPRVEGAFRSVSSADIRVILATTRRYMAKEYGSALPVYSVYVIDPAHVSVEYWVRGQNTVASVERVGRHWKVTGTEAERIITTGRSIPTS